MLIFNSDDLILNSDDLILNSDNVNFSSNIIKSKVLPYQNSIFYLDIKNPKPF